jgi:hypothetical protein
MVAMSDAAGVVLFTMPYLYTLLLLLSGELRATQAKLEAAHSAGSDREQQLAEGWAALHASETALVARGAELDEAKANLEASELKHAQLQAQLRWHPCSARQRRC